MSLGHGELVVRIAVGAALGGIIGYERDRHGRPVGLRTHLLVALASATFMVVSSQFAFYQHFGHGEGVEVDGSRIAASVVSAIGFLAAGSILRSGASIQGLTTAAGLWLVTAIGLCAGAGMFVESIAVTTMGIVALTVFRRFEDKDDRVTKRRVALVLNGTDADDAARAIAALAADAEVNEVEYERRLDGVDPTTHVTFDVTLPIAITVPTLVHGLAATPGIRNVRVTRPF